MKTIITFALTLLTLQTTSSFAAPPNLIAIVTDSSELLTCCPSPVRSRWNSAAQIPIASAHAAGKSTTPVAWISSGPPGR